MKVSGVVCLKNTLFDIFLRKFSNLEKGLIIFIFFQTEINLAPNENTLEVVNLV